MRSSKAKRAKRQEKPTKMEEKGRKVTSTRVCALPTKDRNVCARTYAQNARVPNTNIAAMKPKNSNEKKMLSEKKKKNTAKKK